jgi:hypothetical protein
MSFFDCHAIRDEATLCSTQMERTDVCFYFHHSVKRFMMMDSSELQQQLKLWRGKCVIQDYNIFDITINKKKFYIAIVQPISAKELEGCSISPLALAYNILVSGYAYVFKFKSAATDAMDYLTPKDKKPAVAPTTTTADAEDDDFPSILMPTTKSAPKKKKPAVARK